VTTQPEGDAALRLDGRLHRSDLSTVCVLIGVAMAILLFSAPGPTDAAVIAVIGLAGLGLLVPRTREPATLVIEAERVTLVRPGRAPQHAPWRWFTRVQLESLKDAAIYPGADWWRLTIINAMKPSLGSFIHDRLADENIFHFPIVVDFPSDESAAREFVERFEQGIRGAIQPLQRRVRRPPADHDRLLRLHACMNCAHSLQGLDRDGASPECRWVYEHGMFASD